MSGKYALIIGNTEYIDPGLAQLSAPGKDAEDFARVLRDQEIGAFDNVKILLNQLSSTISESIDEFFDQKKPDDLLVLYFSGHGVRDELGSLYLAVRNTIRSRLRSTAIKSDYIREVMDQSRSKRQVLILDCCNSGAVSQGTKAATGVSIGTASAFEGGYGRIILTASDSTQFAWEGDKVIGETNNSLFTHYLVEGLKGDADNDGDGRITVDELYDYAYEKVKLATPKQTPSKFSTKQQGEIILRQSTRIEDIKPVALPDDLVSEIEDPRPVVREWAVQRLEKILKGKNIGMARSAAEALERMVSDENTTRRVAQLATQALESYRQIEQKEVEERKAKEEAVRFATLKAQEERLTHESAEAQQRTEAEQKAKEKAEQLAKQKEEERIAKAKIEAQRLAAQKGKDKPLASESAKIQQGTAKLAHNQTQVVITESPKEKLEKSPKVRWTTRKKWIVVSASLLILIFISYSVANLDRFYPIFKPIQFVLADKNPSSFSFGRIIPEVDQVAFSPDGKSLASVCISCGGVQIWNISNGTLVQTLDTRGTQTVAFSPDGGILAFGLGGKEIGLWHVNDNKLWETLKGHTKWINGIAFSPDGHTLASSSDDKTVSLWQVSDGSLLTTFKGHTDKVVSVTFSPDGQLIASSSIDNTIQIWRANNGTILRTIQELHYTGENTVKKYSKGLAFSPDGQIIASGSVDGIVHLWQVSDGTLLNTLRGHNGAINSIAFSPNGHTLASASDDGTVRLWRISDGTIQGLFEVDTLQDAAREVTSVTFSPDGKLLATSANNGTIRLWNVALSATETHQALPTDTPTIISTETPTPPLTFTSFASTPVALCDKYSFIGDVTIPDNTVMTLGQIFIKTWRVKNMGSCIWDNGYKLVFSYGDTLKGEAQPLSARIGPGQEAEFSVQFTAPNLPGTYTSYWTLQNAKGVTFQGSDNRFLYVQIVVK